MFRPANDETKKVDKLDNSTVSVAHSKESKGRLNVGTCSTPEFRMSVLLSREDGCNNAKSSPSLLRRCSSKSRDKRLVEDDDRNEEKVAPDSDQAS